MKKILLVEDTTHLSEEIADILRLEGFSVTTSSNALQGLELLSECRPDLIITDLLMPGMDGFEFIQKVKQHSAFNSIPIIILSAKTSDADRKRGNEVGASDFIQKPCKGHELVASINSLLQVQTR